ncbi:MULTISPECIES: Bug family tripartite tricarboxylate transporter substrate binding protein [Comamonas]|jgi:tripartite-type tricarboxylate transporter receptor subunit TctC|uniref:Tripartite tricarboxylate transporter substrate binding protein n=1 Tax=Comamonas terrigena TaxID=32013 RepID=A0A2A7V0D2_COMTR|nr:MULTISPECIES: tripartite tricarboxylate transporter substrate binding protein [Comamonas]MBD9530752.1 tripartite tricarboxylate transporter substrate binding protein [Comamonas sp. CMM01]MBV7417832.1 tripartite tricarboxylate transporter substrate binding protein [Comamonas sp. CMM03]MDH1291706.1 tripartite tricarboxylate transporter substrate binding protein [Comamonas terrigena]MDH1703756.1 tripartite tricarboxylate transporter substrate binding protein [Comamonas terrigena]MDI9855108.1 t
MQRRTLIALCASLAAVATMPQAGAQGAYPNRPITLIVPYGAGGVTDVIARALAQGMSKPLGQTIVIENKPGAGASMGVVDMKNAKPDGYRLTLTPVGIFRQPHIQKVNFDPVADVSYVAAFMTYDFILAVPANSPFKSVKDVVDAAKRDPGSVDYGTPGKFSANHVTMAQLEQKTGAKFTHVPFKGDADSINSLLAGHTKTAVFANSVQPYLTSGKMRALAIASDKRTEAFADVPTFRELGYAFDVPSPLGIAGPKALPAEITQKLEAAIQSAMQEPAFKQVAANYGIRLEYRNAQEYSAFAKKAFAEEKDIVKAIGLD